MLPAVDCICRGEYGRVSMKVPASPRATMHATTGEGASLPFRCSPTGSSGVDDTYWSEDKPDIARGSRPFFSRGCHLITLKPSYETARVKNGLSVCFYKMESPESRVRVRKSYKAKAKSEYRAVFTMRQLLCLRFRGHLLAPCNCTHTNIYTRTYVAHCSHASPRDASSIWRQSPPPPLVWKLHGYSEL